MRIQVLIVGLAVGLLGPPLIQPHARAEAQAMSEKLIAPVTVPLDFLARIDRDPAWLQDAMAGLGVGGEFEIGEAGLVARTVAAARAANRIRAFSTLAAQTFGPPYIDLTVDAGKGETRCPTLFADQVVPGITAMDFTAPVLSADGADPTLLDLCRVDQGRASEYEALDRDTFRNRYFDSAGDLRSDFAALNGDAALVARALDLGFYVTQGDLTGRLKLGAE